MIWIRRTTAGIAAAAVFALTPTAARAQGPMRLKQPKVFPISITKSGSYILTENIVVPDADTTAIQVAADNATIDPGGFSILGPVTCSIPLEGLPSCAPRIAGYADNTLFNNGGGLPVNQVQCGLNLGSNACGAELCP